jgi:hypothetical protein
MVVLQAIVTAGSLWVTMVMLRHLAFRTPALARVLPRPVATALNLMAGGFLLPLRCQLSRRYRRSVPTANLEQWNDEWYRRSNCYAYGLAVHQWRSIQPGYRDLRRTGVPLPLASVAELRTALRTDGLLSAKWWAQRPGRAAHLVVVLFAPDRDYHVVRLGADGWADKPGPDPARYLPYGPLLACYDHPYLLVGYYWVEPDCEIRRLIAAELEVRVIELERI